MATATPTADLTEAYRSAESKQAAKVAALVALYFQQRVNADDPRSIEQWLAAMVPIIERERAASAARAVLFGGAMRRLELGVDDGFRFRPVELPELQQIVRTSLIVTAVTGKTGVRPALARVSGQDLSPAVERALLDTAKETGAAAAGAAAARHVQNGGRGSLIDGVARDKLALGWVRVTKPDPCYFCAMLASRGAVYKGDSFVDSNTMFDGPGEIKVHDSCGCSLKPLYRRDDPLLEQSQGFSDLWAEIQDRRPAGVSMISWWRQQYGNR